MDSKKGKKKTEKALSKSEELFRSTFEQAAVGITHVAPDGRFLRINQKFCAIVGYSHDEMLERTFQDITHPADLDADLEYVRQMLAGEISTYSMEKRYFRKSGEIVWVNLTVSLVRNEANQPQWFVSVVEDITQRKQMEEALRESEEKFRLLVEQSPFSIQILNTDGRINQINEAFKKLWGIAEETLPEVLEKYNIFEDEEAAKLGVIPAIRQAFSGEVVILPLIEYDATKTMVDLGLAGTEAKKIWLQSSFYPVKNSKGEVVNIVNIEQDITENKRAEQEMNLLRSELIHSTRMGTMVELTAALAHEINHPLGSILNNANAAKRILGREDPDMDEVREIIDDIISEDIRASDVIQKLRALMKKTEIELVPLQINDIMEEVLQLTQSELIIKNVSFSKNLEEGLPKVKGDRTQLQQVLLNLIINACDAMKESETKKLFVSTKMHDKKTILVHIKDTGHGVDEKKKEKLFDPFFTTKKEGMGMGLSVCRTIIRAHGRDIWAENDPEGGASFFVTLPLQKEKKS